LVCPQGVFISMGETLVFFISTEEIQVFISLENLNISWASCIIIPFK
jgi:hypothetical protein